MPPPSPLPFTLLRNFPEHLNVTTRLALSIISSPIAGFLPRLSFFSFTQNLPNPLTRTSSPDARVDLMVSMSCSTNSVLFFWGNPSPWLTASMMSALVRAIFGVLWGLLGGINEFVKDTGLGWNCQRI